jgi:CRP-like cAMP-binding protein
MNWNLQQNHLLASLPESVAHDIRPHLDLIQLSVNQVLHRTDSNFQHIYFPLTSIISIQMLQSEGTSNEVGTVGNEGCVGAAFYLSNVCIPLQAIVRGAGQAYRIPRPLFSAQFANPDSWLTEFLRFSQTLYIQSAQTAVCNRHHTIEQQLCRLLLATRDRVLADPLRLTHDMIATLLGVRREGITEAARKLQHAGLIHYSHGKITLIDRTRLEQRTCECYAVIRLALARLIIRDDPSANRVSDCAGTDYV